MPKGHHFGSKLSVITKRKAKKRAGFHGKPAWKKKAEKGQRKDATKLTFVRDCDVGESDCETEKSPPVSSSKRKLDATYNDSEEEYESKAPKESAEGYRLVFMDSLRDLARRIHAFTGSCEGSLLIIEDSSKCFGLCSSLYVQCDSCEMNEFFSTGKHSLSDLVPRTMQGKDINRRTVFASNEVGIGREGLAAICEVLDMPPPVAPNAWAAHDAELYKQHLVAVREELEKNQQEVKQYCNDNGLTSTSVSFDGTWAKRGFTSNHGVGFVISTETGKVLDYAVESKACNACNIQQKKLSEEDFQSWQENHDCPGDFVGSSPSMESACAKQAWERSTEIGLQYRYMVSDGDSKAYDVVCEVYGVCEDCEVYNHMNKSSAEYKAWKDSPAFKEYLSSHMEDGSECRKVVKLDCVGHVQKRMGKALRTLQQQKGKLDDGKPVGGKSGRLTKPAVEKLQKYYGNAIRNNVKKGTLTTEQRNIAITAMKTEIKAGLYHSCQLPDNERHQFCPYNSWCAFKNHLKKFTNKRHHLDPIFVQFLEPTYARLTNDALLERCLPGNTQNPNECLNSLVWMRCPKHKWFGRKRVEMAAISAVFQFSSGATAKHRIMELADIPAGNQTATASIRRDNQRVKKAEKRVSDQYKKYRRATKRVSVRVEESRIEKEGTTYEAGAF